MAIKTGTTPLEPAECWVWLRAAQVGRLCYTEFALPVIRAVPFLVDEMSVVVALNQTTLPPDKFRRPSIVAFEAGEWVPDEQRGWSVRLVGRAEPVPQPEVAKLVGRRLTPWIDGEPAFYVRVEAETLAGVRVGPDPSIPTFPGPRRNGD